MPPAGCGSAVPLLSLAWEFRSYGPLFCRPSSPVPSPVAASVSIKANRRSLVETRFTVQSSLVQNTLLLSAGLGVLMEAEATTNAVAFDLPARSTSHRHAALADEKLYPHNPFDEGLLTRQANNATLASFRPSAEDAVHHVSDLSCAESHCLLQFDNVAISRNAPLHYRFRMDSLVVVGEIWCTVRALRLPYETPYTRPNSSPINTYPALLVLRSFVALSSSSSPVRAMLVYFDFPPPIDLHTRLALQSAREGASTASPSPPTLVLIDLLSFHTSW